MQVDQEPPDTTAVAGRQTSLQEEQEAIEVLGKTKNLSLSSSICTNDIFGVEDINRYQALTMYIVHALFYLILEHLEADKPT